MPPNDGSDKFEGTTDALINTTQEDALILATKRKNMEQSKTRRLLKVDRKLTVRLTDVGGADENKFAVGGGVGVAIGTTSSNSPSDAMGGGVGGASSTSDATGEMVTGGGVTGDVVMGLPESGANVMGDVDVGLVVNGDDVIGDVDVGLVNVGERDMHESKSMHGSAAPSHVLKRFVTQSFSVLYIVVRSGGQYHLSTHGSGLGPELGGAVCWGEREEGGGDE